MTLRALSQPPAEPLTLEEAKTHLRVTSNDEDTYIAALIVVAREYCENVTGQAFVQREMQWIIDDFPACTKSDIILPVAPVLSVESVIYTDTDGNETQWSDEAYGLLQDSIFPKIFLAYGESWPSDVRDVRGAVKIEFVAGYEPSESGSPIDYAVNIPEAIKHAMRLIIGHFYENRMEVTRDALSVMPMAVTALLSPYRIRGF